MTAKQVLSELKKLGTPSVKKMLMANHGVEEPCFGVKIGDMKPIVKKIKGDHELALELYATGNYDAMYLAGLIAEDERMTRRDLQTWANQSAAGCLASATVAGTAAQGRYGWELGMKWIDSVKVHVADTGWSTLGGVVALKDDADLDLAALKKLITRVKKEIHKAPDGARYGMNNFLISVGASVVALTDLVLKTAESIGPVTADLGNNSCKIPFAPDYIRRIEKRGAIGKKRKTIKC